MSSYLWDYTGMIDVLYYQQSVSAGFQRQLTGIRGQEDNEDTSQERSLWCQEAGYLLHHYVLQQRDPLLHRLMSFLSNACRWSPGCMKGVTRSRGRESREERAGSFSERLLWWNQRDGEANKDGAILGRVLEPLNWNLLLNISHQKPPENKYSGFRSQNWKTEETKGLKWNQSGLLESEERPEEKLPTPRLSLPSSSPFVFGLKLPIPVWERASDPELSSERNE